MIECHQRAAHITTRLRSCANANPIQFASNPGRARLSSNPANSNDSIEGQPTDSPHAILIAKVPVPVGISFVGSFVHECSHLMVPTPVSGPPAIFGPRQCYINHPATL